MLDTRDRHVCTDFIPQNVILPAVRGRPVVIMKLNVKEVLSPSTTFYRRAEMSA